MILQEDIMLLLLEIQDGNIIGKNKTSRRDQNLA